MKKVYTFLIVLLSLFFVPNANASHVLGGEITWECLNDGRYVFKLKIYLDCSGSSWSYSNQNSNQTLQVFGNPLPTNLNNQPFSAINLMPDSATWLQRNNGDISPICSQSTPQQQMGCDNNNVNFRGAVQALWYMSDTLILKGVPPASGWHFKLETGCCRQSLENLFGGATGTSVLRAVMYPDRNNLNTYPCINSSPTFSAVPTIPKCKNFYITMNQSVNDKEQDLVVYDWDRAYDIPASNPTPRQYASGFNYNNPTPDQSFDSTNIPATIDKETGIINYAVYGGPRGGYLLVNRVDEYRDGQKISSVFRESPVFLLDCPPIDNTTPNNQPEFYFDNVKQNEYEIAVEAGDKVEFPVQVVDNDSGATGLPQEVTLFTSGNQFAADFVDTTNCANPPCAVLKNIVPQYDSSRNRYQVSGANVVTTDFEWQTNCGHLNADGSQKTYYFYFSAKDDHCPVPQQVDTYVKVTVGGDSMDYSLAMECTGDKGRYNQLNWSAGVDIAGGFSKWYIYAGNSINQLQLIDSLSNFNTQFYNDSLKYSYYQVKTTTSCNNQQVELKTKVVEVDYFNILNKSNLIHIECVEELSSTNTVTWSVDSVIENEFKQWYIYAGNTPPLQLVDSIADFNDRVYIDNQKLAYYKVKAGISSVCVNDTLTLESPIRRRGYQRYPIDVSILDTNRIIIAQDSAADSYQWYDCNTDTIITDSTRQSFAPQDSGYYAVIITKGYCSDTTDCVRIFPVGLNENSFQHNVRFYPNPSSGLVNIELPQKQQSLQVKVRNIHGQLVQEKQFVNQGNLQLQLNGKPGIYFIELVNEKGERANVKVVKR